MDDIDIAEIRKSKIKNIYIEGGKLCCLYVGESLGKDKKLGGRNEEGYEIKKEIERK